MTLSTLVHVGSNKRDVVLTESCHVQAARSLPTLHAPASGRLVRAFRRVTTRGDYIPAIDGFRFVAIVSVVLFHLLAQLDRYYRVRVPSLLANVIGNGDRGVRLFFVISGFVLALPFARYYMEADRPVSLRRYFMRRLSRLEPPFILAMLGFAALLCLRSTPPRHEAVHLLASVAYCHNLIFGQPSSINPVAWSLEVEIQFYVLVPLLTLVFGIRSSQLRRGILIATIVALGLAQEFMEVFWIPRVQISLVYYLQFFLAGFLLVDLFLSRQTLTRHWTWDLVSACGWPLVFLLPADSVQIALPLLIPILYWAALRGRLVKGFFEHPLITAIGGMCYTIYLLHFGIIAAVTRMGGHHRPVFMVLLSLAMIASISAVYFLIIEKPCMNPCWPAELLGKVRKRGIGYGGRIQVDTN